MPRRAFTAGFSLLEVMISTGVLAIALVGLIRVHSTTVRGVVKSRQAMTALRIADQRAELLATQRPDALLLPACPVGVGPVGCRIDSGALASAKACTTYHDGPDVPTPSGASVASPLATITGYRMDVVIGAHPDAINQGGGFLATISVCWVDENGLVREVQARRLLVPGT